MTDIQGLGHSRKRVEDGRFIQGKGNYIDDLKLPGMLYLDIVRSPYAHARIKSINTDKAMATPGVLAVITGETMKAYNVHNMPTLMSDTQMVLPLDTVKYQYQEVAGVMATDRYTAADGVAVGAVAATAATGKLLLHPHLIERNGAICFPGRIAPPRYVCVFASWLR